MSLTDVVSSTVSTVINNIILVVNEGSSSPSSSSSVRQGFDSSILTLHRNDNSVISPSSFTPSKSTVKPPPLVEQGVAQDLSPTEINTVICMLVIFSVFGCLGNGLVLYVFTKKSDKVTSTIFILALAWTDFLTCLIIMPYTVADILLDSHLHLDILCKAYQFLITSNVPLSAFIMVAIAVDRYFSICHPFMRVVTPRRARFAIICLVMVAFTLGTITACLFTVRTAAATNETDTQNNTIHCCNQTVNTSFLEHVRSLPQSLAQTSETVSLPGSPSVLADKDFEIIINNSSFQKMLIVNDTTTTTESNPQHRSDDPILISVGLCIQSENIFSKRFAELYQKIYISFYIISLLAVFTLYFFIYRSVAERREWRRKQKSFSHAPMTVNNTVVTVDNCKGKADDYCAKYEHLELAPQSSSVGTSNSGSKANGGGKGSESGTVTDNATSLTVNTSAAVVSTKNCSHENGVENSDHNKSSAEKKTNRERRDFNFLANIRTAIMLFVVTLVFIISFLPAWLMATSLINFKIIVFYMHYNYNVANPVIYAFMNQSFRKELKRVFQRGTNLLRGG